MISLSSHSEVETMQAASVHLKAWDFKVISCLALCYMAHKLQRPDANWVSLTSAPGF